MWDINGFGRIGRNFTRAVIESGADIEIVAANKLGDNKTSAHLLKYDQFWYEDEISYDESSITMGSQKITMYNESDPSKIPWGDHDVDTVIEATGLFRDAQVAMSHRIRS